ncbi:MAG: FMN-binding negative transcriptional regulator [Chloroflexi bacterium]|nr:FMN-binding negative transcriptional regulator [Chloroflexota bacterium]
MYLPKAYAETDIAGLRERIREYPFGTLITSGVRGLTADFLPFVVSDDASVGTLRGHVARANPVWEDHDPAADCLVLFHGPHAYITPRWYPSARETSKAVPTWNYVVVQARGRLRVREDREWLLRNVEELTVQSEHSRADPWRMSDAPGDYIDRLLGGIVGIEVEIIEIVGKRKANQGRPPDDLESVAAELRALGHPFAKYMKPPAS